MVLAARCGQSSRSALLSACGVSRSGTFEHCSGSVTRCMASDTSRVTMMTLSPVYEARVGEGSLTKLTNGYHETPPLISDGPGAGRDPAAAS